MANRSNLSGEKKYLAHHNEWCFGPSTLEALYDEITNEGLSIQEFVFYHVVASYQAQPPTINLYKELIL